jgi:hypothetical protein
VGIGLREKEKKKTALVINLDRSYHAIPVVDWLRERSVNTGITCIRMVHSMILSQACNILMSSRRCSAA